MALMLFMLVLVCICLVAFFSGMETGFISVNRIKIHHAAKEKKKQAMRVDRMLRSPNRVLGVTLLGTNLFVVFAATLFEVGLSDILGPHGEWMTTLLLTPCILIFAEIIPKNVFRKKADIWVPFCSGALAFCMYLFQPFVWGINMIVKGILFPFFRADMKSGRLFVNREELKYIVKESEKQGVIESQKRALVHSIFDFGKKKISDVMIPLKNVVALEVSKDVSECIAVAKKTKCTRIALYEEKPQSLIGFVNIFDILYNKTSEGEVLTLRKMIRPVYYVKKEMFIDNVFFTMRLKRLQMAVVVDQENRALGIVMIDDLLDEIIGEV